MIINMMTMGELEYAIANYGTPLYVFDMDETAKTIAEFRKKTNGIAEICFAMKANPFLAGQMAELADRIEVCSMGEYEICRKLMIPPEKMLISGVLKERKNLERIMYELRDSCRYSVESVNQFYCIAKWCQTHKQTLRIYLRLTSGNQFGMDEKTLKELICAGSTYPFVKIAGIHFFSGTQKRSADIFRKELRRLDELCCEIKEVYGLEIPELEYGPGLKMPYFEGQPDTRAEDTDSLCRAIGEMNWKGRVTLEMGRYLVAPAGYYLTAVKDLKTSDQNNYCIVDGGIHQIHYDGQIKGMYPPCLRVSPRRDIEYGKEWTICGSLCTDNDVLVRKIHMQELKIGDVLIFQRAGAYGMTEGMALFLSHSLPKVALYSRRKGWRLAREEQETFLWNMEAKHGNFAQDFRRN